MNKMIKVLWFEDEYEKMDNFLIQARGENLELVPFRSAEEGIEELQKNYSHYDAVIMDAKFFLSREHEAGSEELSALAKTKAALDALSSKKKFEVFVFTGQAKLFQDSSFDMFVPKYYKKGVEEDVHNLIADIKKSANNQIDTQIRHKFQRVFDVCSEKYIGEKAGHDLLDILKNQDSMDSKKYLNVIRNIIEDLFKAFHKFELLPSEFISGTIDLNPTCRFLIGTAENGFKLDEEARLPKIIGHNLWSLLNHSQTGSHRSHIDEHINTLASTFLFNALTFKLLDVLIWFKDYVDKGPMKKKWKNGVSNSNREEKGFVKYIDEKNRGLIVLNDTREEIILSGKLIEQYRLKARDKVVVFSSEYIENIADVLHKRMNKIQKI